MIGPVGFLAPWLLVALAALPILWLLLRAVPPAPLKRRFPGVALLLGLKDDMAISARTPWWLLLLRMLAVAALIVGLAGPVLNPQAAGGGGNLLLVLDGGWPSAREWRAQRETLDAMLAEAARDGRPVAALRLTAPDAPVFQPAGALRDSLPGLAPEPWVPTPEMLANAAEMLGDQGFETRWFSDGVARDGRQELLDALAGHGPVSVYQSGLPLHGLSPAVLEEGRLKITTRRLAEGPAEEITIEAHGTDPTGAARVLARLPLQFAEGAKTAEGMLTLPPELRARLTRLQIADAGHAGAVSLSDDSLQRREVALIASRAEQERSDLLSPLHYLEQALAPRADILKGALMDMLPANPDVIILADVATLSGGEQAALLEWVEGGGMLLRFAGPRLAASDLARQDEASLMPVRLRAGGRTIGGAMSWGEPKALAPFPEDSPFYGLAIPEDVRVNAQVLAQPGPELTERAIARLTDGTPLVTRKRLGQGQVVLFHVTANAEWSSLPLSGLFVQMLERLAIAALPGQPEAGDMAGTTWQPETVLDAFGRSGRAEALPGVAGEDLLAAPLGPDLRPGVYSDEDHSLARNVLNAAPDLAPAAWPAGVAVRGYARPAETPLGGWLLAAALLCLMADILATLAMSGRLWLRAALVLLAVMLMPTPPATAQNAVSEKDILATSDIVLAHVLTGDEKIDDIAQAGLRGLGQILTFRSSVEPAEPIGVDLEEDDLAVYSFLYWPVTPDQPLPSTEAYLRLNAYLRTGGMILFDTRDADTAGGQTAPSQALRRLAAPLDIPPLEPVPEDHVLTRAFYLLKEFPGRYTGPLWVEAAPAGAERPEGMPFRNLNDGVTPVVIGGNDWASAWAVDARGNPMFPVGRGYGGERQREIANRFGVNLVMYVLTGNYKSDQVHVPALLDRLSQ